MNALNKKRELAGMMAILFLGLAACLLSACNDEMDVQQSYPFKVETLPVPTRIVKGETVEIRCELKREGRFSDARYTIRYFQPDGKGTLRMDDGMVLLPNDRYPLDREVFRLYYTSESENQQTIDIYFEVNMNEDIERIQRLKRRVISMEEIYMYIGLLTALRVSHDSSDRNLSSSVETYPLNQGQISIFTEEVLKLAMTKGQITAWELYNIATEIYKPGKTDFPALIPQNGAMAELLLSHLPEAAEVQDAVPVS